MRLYKKIYSFFKRIDELEYWKAFMLLLLTAGISLIFALLPFAIRKTPTVWTSDAADAATQSLAFLKFIKSYNWFGGIGKFSFKIGLGADILSSLSFYAICDPFNFFEFISPFDEFATYGIIMFFKQLACAITMFVFLKYKHIRNSRSICLSTMYILTGFVIFTFTRHYNLTAGPIYFPLVIMGLEKVYNKERPYLLIISVFLCLITNFYAFFTVSAFAIIYLMANEIDSQIKTTHKFSISKFILKLAPAGLYYILGILLAGFILFPSISGYMNAARSASKGLISMTFRGSLGKLASFILPIGSTSYSILAFNIFILYLVSYSMFKKNRDLRVLKILILTLSIGFIFPVFGFCLNIFNYSNNRWSFVLNFFVFTLIGLSSRDVSIFKDENTLKKTHKFIITYLLTMIALILPSIGEHIGYNVWIILGSVLILIITICLIFFVWKNDSFKKPIPVFKHFKILILSSFLCSLIYAVVFNTIYSNQHKVQEFNPSLYSEEEKYVSGLNDNEFFRTDSSNGETWDSCFNNRPINNDYYGTREYNTISSNYVYEFLKENGVYNPPQNLGISGLDNRFVLQSLLSVKYYFDKDQNNYGYSKVDGFENLYQNSNYLPMGYMMYDTYSREYFDTLDPLDKQYAMLNGIVLDDGGSIDNTFVSKLQKTVISTNETILENNKFNFNVEGIKNHEVYVAVHGVNDLNDKVYIDIEGNDIKRQYYYTMKGNLMYSDQRDFYLNFGVMDKTKNLDFSILPNGNDITVDSIEVIQIDTSDTQKSLNELKNHEALKSLKVTDNNVTGTIQAEKDGYLFLSVPYTKGFSAYVDGVKTDILNANTAFMALKLDAGLHNIELKYETPYFKIGSYVSIAGIVILLATTITIEISIHNKKRKIKNGEAIESSKLKKLIDKIFDEKTIKFLIVGVANTLVGSGLMFILYNCFHLNYWVSSISNYIVGCILSYFLNKYWSFKNKERSWKVIVRFIITVAICYGVAYGLAKPLVNYLLKDYSLKIRDNISMLSGMILYTVLNYFGQRFFAFTDKKKNKD